jgi:hypothetical protein
MVRNSATLANSLEIGSDGRALGGVVSLIRSETVRVYNEPQLKCAGPSRCGFFVKDVLKTRLIGKI